MQSRQSTLSGESLLDCRINESLGIIRKVLSKSPSVPLIINFSGGKDSRTLLDLVQKVTDHFVCFYMVSGIEFPEAIEFVEKTCDELQVKLLLSRPSDYKGGFFERLPTIGYFPTVQNNTLWCNRDLKIRPQKRVLDHIYGKNLFLKLNGVRRNESARRRKMHKATRDFMKPDYHVSNGVMVFPILNWTDENIREYLERERVRIKPNPLYKQYEVSGCYWCPFYQCSIYKRILRINPNLYDLFIEWEEKLNKPSVNSFVWLKDLKAKTLKQG